MTTENQTTAGQEEHYAWGASGAKTWRGCPGSINYARQEKDAGNIPEDDESAFAREGTIAHQYADDVLTGKISEDDVPATFYEHLQGYIMFARELAEEVGAGDCIVANEQRVPLFYNTNAHGTLDYGVVAEDASEVAILDLKYGAGVYVTAEENDQGIIYATSWIKELEAEGYVFADDAKVRIFIYQPRHFEFTGEPECWETTYRDLLDYAIDVERDYQTSKAAEVTDLNPSEAACKFCDARVICQKRVIDMFDEVPESANMLVPANHDGPNLPAIGELDDKARVAIFKHAKEIEKWMKDVNADSIKRLENGDTIVGLKTVDGKLGNRTWGDNEADVEKLLRKIPAAKRYKPRRVLSPAQAEKVLKSEDKPLKDQSTKFQNRWKELIVQKPGSPVLALESDPKPARLTGSDKFDEQEPEVNVDDCF